MNWSNIFWTQFSKKSSAVINNRQPEYRTAHCATSNFSNKLWKKKNKKNLVMTKVTLFLI